MMLSTNDLRKACEIPNDASLGQLARQQLPLLADHIETLYRAIAASRALVAEKDKALEIGRGMEGHAFGCICVGEGDGEHSPFCAEQARALALTEEAMLERLERKEA